MNLSLLRCALFGHRYTTDAGHTPGDITAPATCACGMRHAGIVWDKGESKHEPTAERVQIITAKAGDTIAVMSDAYMSANERLLLIALFQAKLPEGVRVMVFDRGMKLAHVEAATPVLPQPTPERSSGNPIPMPSPGRATTSRSTT